VNAHSREAFSPRGSNVSIDASRSVASRAGYEEAGAGRAGRSHPEEDYLILRIDRKAETREQLIGATEALICEGGLSAVTTQSVAKKGGFAEGTIYRHFKNRDDLIISTMRERLAGDFDEAVAVLERRAGQGDLVENLRTFVAAILPVYTVMAPAVGMLAADPALAAQHAESMSAHCRGPRKFAERLANYFIEEQRLGRISAAVDPNAAAGMLVSLCFYRSLIGHLFGEDPTGLADSEVPAAVTTILTRGIIGQVPPPRQAARPRRVTKTGPRKATA